MKKELPIYGQPRTEAVCPQCGKASATRQTVCGGPAIALLCNDCRRASLTKGKLSVQFCVGGCCTRAGAREAMEALLTGLREQNALGPGRVSVIPVDCVDMCEDGPIVRVLPDRKTSRRVSPSWAKRLGQDLARDRRARK